MSGIRNTSGSAASRRKRVIKVAPMTRAVRVALAASLAALALGASGGAFAAGCKTPSAITMSCAPLATDATPVLDLTLVHDAAMPAVRGVFIMPLAINESAVGDVVIDNAAPISEFSLGDAIAISGYSSAGSVDISNQASGQLEAISVYANAIGIYAYSLAADASIDNSGDIAAISYYGLADGIFASGADVSVSNSGSISAYGYSWAAGIETQGTGTTSVTNEGDIYAVATDVGAPAYGIYATGDVVVVDNSGSIEAQGYYATGIQAQGGSSVTVTNDGDIVAGSSFTSAVATGINATSNYADGAITISNDGSVSASGYFGGTGIAATATGAGGSASVTNSGTIYAGQYTRNGYGAYGIQVSADGDAMIDTAASSSITAVSAGVAGGAVALSFTGDTSVINAGDINVYGYSAADGIVSFAQNGAAYAGNSGNIDVVSLNTGHGIDVDGFQSATAVNSGDIAVDGYRAFGIRANSGTGDVSVTNDGSIYATYGSYYGYTGRAYGVFAASVEGDVVVDNSGDIQTTVNGQSVGIFGVSSYGDVDVSSSGSVSSYSYLSTAAAVFARADYGMASVDNSGTISAESKYGSAFGVLARGSYADVSNSGDVSASGYAGATGIAANSYYGTTVNNAGGSIYAIAVGRATGIAATSAYGDVAVTNASDIDAIGLVLGATGIRGYAYGNVDIANSGDIYAGSLYGNAIGIYGYSIAGDVSIGSSGDITAYSYYGLADGIFASGANVEVANSGSIVVAGYSWAAGIEAQGTEMTSVINDGDIYAVSMYTTPAFGIYATGDVIEVDNGGNIQAQGYYATGIQAQGDSLVTITNDGDIIAGTGYGSALATGINATSNAENGEITITNNGSVSGVGFFGGTGIAATATGTGGSASVTNNGSVYAAQYSGNGYGAYGIVVSADGDATIDNTATGSITVVSPGTVSGAMALAFNGEASVTNAGDITVYGYSGADGIVSFSQNGIAYAGNSGTVDVSSAYPGTGIDVSGSLGATADNSGDISVDAWRAYGIKADSGAGDVAVTNAGSIYATYSGSYLGTAFGVLATSIQGDVSVDNAGDIYTTVTGQSVGIFGSSDEGNVDVANSGMISAYSYARTSVGVFARADYGTASVDNSGAISAQSYYGDAFGVLARGAYVDVGNSGDITANGYARATGIAASSYYGSTVTTTGGAINVFALGQANGIDAQSAGGAVTVDNASSIEAIGLFFGANGIQGYAYGNVDIGNSGDIYAGSLYGNAIGIHGYALDGDVVVNNSGDIYASGGAVGIGVLMETGAGTATLNNAVTGSISASGPADSYFAVYGSDNVDIINNSGTIHGAVITLGSDDVFNNNNHGTWIVGNHTTDFGDGNDTINNKMGGTILLQDGGIYMGGGTANAFNNQGTIRVAGDGLIDMGGSIMTFAAVAPNLVPSLNPTPLFNNGVIDMTDGAADDSLTIIGDLGGNGSLNIDVMVPNGPSDELHVDGSMVAGAVQTVNATFYPSLLLAAQTGAAVDFAFVTGNSTAGSFVGGQVIGYDPSNFLDLDVVVTGQINTANTADDVFSVGVDVVGLNDTGALAASIASGAAGMLNAQVGTFKQRMGVNPYGDAGKVMSAFFRTYTSEGDVNPSHTMTNFGPGGNFDYDQSVWGREVGVNANLFGNFHAGVVLGSADGRQRLTGTGVGQNRMDGMTWGMYATWLVPKGFYVDLSGRWMAVDVRSTSVAGTLATRAHTGAWNLEAGYEWTMGGLSVVPQLQYTRTTVDDVRPIYGTAATFESHGGTSSRGRVGVEISKTFDSGGIRWTPYGSINAIREFDGDMNYTVANVFNGGTSIQGTSTMAELGLGVQKGDWGFTIGANWMDGGAYKSTVGGQALVRFAW